MESMDINKESMLADLDLLEEFRRPKSGEEASKQKASRWYNGRVKP